MGDNAIEGGGDEQTKTQGGSRKGSSGGGGAKETLDTSVRYKAMPGFKVLVLIH